jgi:hypothetical protein
MDKVQKHNSFNTNTPSLESYRNHETWTFIFWNKVGNATVCLKRITYDAKDISFQLEFHENYRNCATNQPNNRQTNHVTQGLL